MKPLRTLCLLLPLTACGTSSLEGDWDGEIDCDGAGQLGIELEVDDEDDWEYEANGTIERLLIDGEETEIALRWELWQPKTYGGMVVEIDADCMAVPVEGEAWALDCDDFDEIGWDGADEMETEIEDFLGSGTDCTMTLER